MTAQVPDPVTLSERLQAELTSAIRSRNEVRRETLRMARAAAYSIEKANKRPLTDEEMVGVLAREVKMRRESVEAFRAGGREDLAAKEEAEMAILQELLPQQLSENELLTMIGEGLRATGAASARDMGKLMGWLVPRTKGRADGRRVGELAAQALARADLAAHDHTAPGTVQPATEGGSPESSDARSILDSGADPAVRTASAQSSRRARSG